MARLPRNCYPGIAQHIIQRGNNRHVCFAANEDYAAYAQWLYKFSRQYHVAVHAWVFMTNHVHLLVTPDTPDGVSRMMQSIGREYVRYFNYRYKRTGTLWEGRFKSCVVDADNYLLICQRYIELNPVRAGMVSTPDEYIWSSYQSNGVGRTIKLCTPHRVYTELGCTTRERLLAYRELFKLTVDADILDCIRHATNKGMAIGNNKFKAEIEHLTGRRVTALKRGPKPKVIVKDNKFLL